jgi:hypothetical protein
MTHPHGWRHWPPQFGELRAFSESGTRMSTCWHCQCWPAVAERRFQMVFAGSIIGGLLILGYCFSRVKAKREAKKSIQTLFDTK